MSVRARLWQKSREFLDGLQEDLPDEELAGIKRYVERRSREAALVTVTPVSTAQHCIPRSLNPETPSDVYVSMEEKDKGRMNPESTELQAPSNRVATKVRTYFEMRTDGQRFLCLKSRISILRRYL